MSEDNSKVSHLTKSLDNFKKAILENKKGFEEFNTFKNNAEEKNMWAEYGEYIASFVQTNMEELQVKNPEMAIAMKNLLDTDFFQEVEQMNEKNILKKWKKGLLDKHKIIKEHFNYWCDSEEEKQSFIDELEKNEKIKMELQEYNPDNLFENRRKTKEDVVMEQVENVEMIQYKENLFTKLKKWFEKIFNKK